MIAFEAVLLDERDELSLRLALGEFWGHHTQFPPTFEMSRCLPIRASSEVILAMRRPR